MIERLASLPSFNIHAIKGDETVPWFEVTGKMLVKDLLIDSTDLGAQVDVMAVQIMHWGRLEAQARRVWEVEEHKYRVWRDTQYVRLTDPPHDLKQGQQWKKPTEARVEADIRVHEDYPVWQGRLERAEEAYNATRYAREAFVAKKDMLKQFGMRAHDNSGQRLSV